MKKNLLYILLLLSLNGAFAQTSKRKPNSIWIDKPILKEDSVALIKGAFKQISVYECRAKDSVGVYTDTALVGVWLIEIEDSKISSFTWSGVFKNNFDTVRARKTDAKKIVETIGEGPYKLKLVHHFDDQGRISYTENRTRPRYETRYHFDKIEYIYVNGLLSEADYFSPEYDPSNVAYTKYIFKYIE